MKIQFDKLSNPKVFFILCITFSGMKEKTNGARCSKENSFELSSSFEVPVRVVGSLLL